MTCPSPPHRLPTPLPHYLRACFFLPALLEATFCYVLTPMNHTSASAGTYPSSSQTCFPTITATPECLVRHAILLLGTSKPPNPSSIYLCSLTANLTLPCLPIFCSPSHTLIQKPEMLLAPPSRPPALSILQFPPNLLTTPDSFAKKHSSGHQTFLLKIFLHVFLAS